MAIFLQKVSITTSSGITCMSKISRRDMLVLEKICQSIFDKKGFNILTLDVREVSSLTDFCVIAEGNVEKHVKTIADVLCEALREEGKRPIHVEGDQSGDWIIVDYADIIVHLFTPDKREKFALEQLWQEARVVDVAIQLPATKG